MIDCLDTKVCKAHCCAAEHAAEYVHKVNKGRDTEDDFFQLILLNQYLDSLDRYKNSLSLTHSKCGVCPDRKESSCLTEAEAQFILDQIATICGGCSCNC